MSALLDQVIEFALARFALASLDDEGRLEQGGRRDQARGVVLDRSPEIFGLRFIEQQREQRGRVQHHLEA
jgi:hypothetical protein